MEHLRRPFAAAQLAFVRGLLTEGNLRGQGPEDWFGSVVVLLMVALMAAVGFLAAGVAEFLVPTGP